MNTKMVSGFRYPCVGVSRLNRSPTLGCTMFQRIILCTIFVQGFHVLSRCTWLSIIDGWHCLSINPIFGKLPQWQSFWIGQRGKDSSILQPHQNLFFWSDLLACNQILGIDKAQNMFDYLLRSGGRQIIYCWTKVIWNTLVTFVLFNC